MSVLCDGIEGDALVSVHAEHELYVPADRRARHFVGEVPEDAKANRLLRIDIELGRVRALTGRVTGGNGNPVYAGLFDLTQDLRINEASEVPRGGNSKSASVRETVRVDESGRYRLRGARDHLLLVLAYASERLPAWYLVAPAKDEIVQVQDLALDPGSTVEGRVEAPDVLKGVSIRASVTPMLGGLDLFTGTGTERFPFALQRFTWTLGGVVPDEQYVSLGPNGEFRIEGLPRGRVDLRPYFSHPFSTPDTVDWYDPLDDTPHRVRASASGVKLEVRASLLEVESRDPAGRPYEGEFSLEVGGEEADVHRSRDGGVMRIAVPADAPFRMGPAPDGPEFTAVEGRTPGIGERRHIVLRMRPLEPPGSVRFEFPEGVDLPRCKVTWTRDGYAPTHGNIYERTLGFREGRTHLHDLLPGHYVFHFEPVAGGEGAGGGGWLVQEAASDIRSGEETLVHVPMEAGGRWEVTVTNSDTHAFQPCDVAIHTASGEEMDPPTLIFRGIQTSDAFVPPWQARGGNPNLALNPLRPGLYTLRFSHRGFHPEERELQIEARQTTQVFVALRPR